MRTGTKETMTVTLTDDQRRTVRKALGVDTRALVFTVAACGAVKYGGPPIEPDPQGAIQLTQSQKRRVYTMTGCVMDTLEFTRANVPRSSAGPLLLLSLIAGYLGSEDA
jgi:hypothetical protein